MITKGIVEDIIDTYQVRVRLPIFDKVDGAKNATKNEDLSIGTVCCLPNSSYQVNVGDVVFVGFEDNDISKPIILGQLYRDVDSNTLMTLILGTLETKTSTVLSENTTIGDVSANEIKCLSGIKTNIQQQLNSIIEDISKIKEKLG